MALAYTNHGARTTSATAATTTGAITVTAVTGDTIVVAVGTVNTTSNAPTDSGGNTYSQIADVVTNTERITFWATLNIPANVTSVTCTFGSSRYGVAIATYSGVAGFDAINKKTATGSTSPATITLNSSLQSGNWTLGGFVNKGTATWSASTGNLRNNVAGAGTTTPGAAIVDNTTTTVAAAESAGNVWAVTAVEMLSVVTNVTVSPTGSATTSSVGNPTETGSAGVSPTGSTATSSVGSLTISGSANITLTGSVANSAVGSLSISAGANITPSGSASTSSVGSVTVTTSSGSTSDDWKMICAGVLRGKLIGFGGRVN